VKSLLATNAKIFFVGAILLLFTSAIAGIRLVELDWHRKRDV